MPAKFRRLTEGVKDVGVFSKYPDRFVGTTATANINCAPSQSGYIYNFPVAPEVTFGEGELVGLESNIYVNSITPPTTFAIPTLEHYIMKSTNFNEASMTVANDNLVVFGTNYEGENVNIEENFSGDMSNEIIKTVGATQILYEGPYLDAEWAFVNRTGTSGGGMQGYTAFFERYGEKLEGHEIIPIKQLTDSSSYGHKLAGYTQQLFGFNESWVPVKGMKWYDAAEPEWLGVESNISYKLQQEITREVATLSLPETSMITNYHTGQTIYDSDLNAKVYSTIALSNASSLTGGASLNISSLWSGGDTFKDINYHGTIDRRKYGYTTPNPTNENWPICQNAWVAVEIPRPMTEDVAGGDFESQVAPEIYVDFNLDTIQTSSDGAQDVGIETGVGWGPTELEIQAPGTGYSVSTTTPTVLYYDGTTSTSQAEIFITEVNSDGGITGFKWARRLAQVGSFLAMAPGALLDAAIVGAGAKAVFRVVRERTGGSFLGGNNVNRCFAITFADRLPTSEEDLIQFAFHESVYKPYVNNDVSANFMGLVIWKQKEIYQRRDSGDFDGFDAGGTVDTIRVSPLTRAPSMQFVDRAGRDSSNVVTITTFHPHGFKVGDKIWTILDDPNSASDHNMSTGALSQDTGTAVLSVPSNTTLTYSDTGAAVTVSTNYHGKVGFAGDTPPRDGQRIEGSRFYPNLGGTTYSGYSPRLMGSGYPIYGFLDTAWASDVQGEAAHMHSFFVRGSSEDGYETLAMSEASPYQREVPYKMENLSLLEDTWYRARFIIDPDKDGCKVAIANANTGEDLNFEENVHEPFKFSHSAGTYDYIGNTKNGTSIAPWSEPPKYMIIWTNNFMSNAATYRHRDASDDPQWSGWDCQMSVAGDDLDCEVTVNVDKVGFKYFYPSCRNLTISKDNLSYTAARRKIVSTSVNGIYNDDNVFSPTIYSFGVDNLTDLFSNSAHYLMFHNLTIDSTASATEIADNTISAAQVVVITPTSMTNISDGDYIIIYDGDDRPVCFWFSKSHATAGAAFAPTDVACEPYDMVRVNATNNLADFCEVFAADFNSHDSFTATENGTTVTVTNARAGYAAEPIEFETDITFSVTTAGIGTNIAAGFTRTENLGQQGTATLFKDGGGSSTYGLQINEDDAFSGTTQGYMITKFVDDEQAAAETPNLVDNFSTKGVAKVKIDGASAGVVKRENYYASTRVTQIVDAKTGQLRVANPEVMRLSPDTEFVLYQHGKPRTSAYYKDGLKVVGSVGGEGIVQFNKNLSSAGITFLKDENLKNVFIGPKKYWLLLMVNPRDSAGSVLPDRSYYSFDVLSAAPPVSTGTTWNEFQYVDDSYSNKWALNPESADSTALELDTDFGYGSFDEEKLTGGQVLKSNIEAGYNTFDLSRVVGNVDGAIPEGTITFLTLPSSPESDYGFNINTREASSNKPFFITVFEDEIPSSPALVVKPNTDSAFFPEFTWTAKEGDLWYGILMIDTNNIYNQYNNAILHFPFNETGTHATTASTPKEKIADSTTNVLLSGPLYDIEGLAGYALNFDGTNDYVKYGTTTGGDFQLAATSDPTSTATTEMSVVAHIVPDSGASDDRYIIAQEETGGRKFSINLNSTNQVVAKVYRTDANYVQLTSTSIVPADSKTPTSVILTMDTTLKSGNAKLFINGRLEDLTGEMKLSGSSGTNNWEMSSTGVGASMQSGNGYVIMGNSSHSSVTLDRAFDGKIEEVVIYDKVLFPVVPKDSKYLLTKPLSELKSTTSGASKSYTAKLFIKDYHNIRGSSSSEVAVSPAVSWRKAAFGLKAN